MIFGFITLSIICFIGGCFHYYVSSSLETYLYIPMHVQNYLLILTSILIQVDNFQLFNDLTRQQNITKLIGQLKKDRTINKLHKSNSF